MHKQTITIRRVPKSVKLLILHTPGASRDLAKLSGCSQTLVSLVLAGQRNCSKRLWDTILDWYEAHAIVGFVEMAAEDLKSDTSKSPCDSSVTEI